MAVVATATATAEWEEDEPSAVNDRMMFAAGVVVPAAQVDRIDIE